MTPDTAIRARRRAPRPAVTLPPQRRAGTLYSGPTTGVTSVAAWYTACCSRYGGQAADVRLKDTPAHVAALLVRLRQRFGTDGLDPRGRAWVERMIHTQDRAERREMAEALRDAANGPAAA